jgi:hypothetical protein
MDPVTAIGLLSNIIGFIDLGWNIFKDAREVYKSGSGMTESALTHKSMAEKMEEFSNNLIPHHTALLTSNEDKVIVELACNCRKLAREIIQHLDKTRPRDSRSILQIVAGRFKTSSYYSERKELRDQLAEYRQQLHLHLSKSTRYVTHIYSRCPLVIVHLLTHFKLRDQEILNYADYYLQEQRRAHGAAARSGERAWSDGG